VTGAALLASILKRPCEDYNEEHTDEKCVSCDGMAIAEPPGDTKPIPFQSLLPVEIAQVLCGPGACLIPGKHEQEVVLAEMNPRYDGVLGKRHEASKYFSRSDVWPAWELCPAEEARGSCKLATVPERSGNGLRKILMVCPFSAIFAPLIELFGPDVADAGLQGSGAVAQVFSPDDVLFVSTLDQANAFTFIEVPR
jgi:hypothetical protein